MSLPLTKPLTEPVWGPQGCLLDGTPISGDGFLSAYEPAFADSDAPFFTWYEPLPDKSLSRRSFTRGQFWRLGQQAATVLRRHGLRPGEIFLNAFGGNRWEDLAFRLGAVMTGTVPATINWQADDLAKIQFKQELTQARLVLSDASFDPALLAGLRAAMPALAVYDVAGLAHEAPLPASAFATAATDTAQATRIIIFTSGTTGKPKGAALSYRSYAVNRLTFEHFLRRPPGTPLCAVLVNPLHHTNSTAISDWLMRRPGAEIHLIERYTTPYWQVLADCLAAGHEFVLAPLVSRHIDFLETLREEGRLPLLAPAIKPNLGKLHLLLGSAPVGPTTVKRVVELGGRPPVVRFGSTETCLQVAGIPQDLSTAQIQAAFEAGWRHVWQGEPCCGYYIGQDHWPCTSVAFVRSSTPGDPGYLTPCAAGEPGLLVTRGANLMSHYVGDPARSAQALADGWYHGLGDVGFWLPSAANGRADLYWFNRSSGLIIRGGANYSCEQVSEELAALLAGAFGVSRDAFVLAAVGLRHDSEHEDSCCVTVELKAPDAALAERLRREFLPLARERVSKGAKPDYLRLAPVPVNFKGSALVPELQKAFFAGDVPVVKCPAEAAKAKRGKP